MFVILDDDLVVYDYLRVSRRSGKRRGLGDRYFWIDVRVRLRDRLARARKREDERHVARFPCRFIFGRRHRIWRRCCKETAASASSTTTASAATASARSRAGRWAGTW